MRSKRPFRSLIVCASCAMVGCILASTAYSRRVDELEIERDIYASRFQNWQTRAIDAEENVGRLQTEVDNLTAELNAQTDLTLTYAGSFSCTAYCAEEYAHICGEGHGITSSGAKVQPGVTVAADTSILPYGTVVYIEGVGLRVVQDTGSAVVGNKMDVAVNKVVDNYRIDQSQLEEKRTQQLQSCTTAQQRQQVNREFDAKQQQSTAALMENLQSTIQQTAQEMQQTIVRTVETNQKEQEKKGYEDTVRDHLRGFSRTIPSFLMAYGDENVTLANLDQIIPDKVFQEVTSITLEQFRFLRDGGPYINQATGQEEHFAGHLFDPVVFDDSVKEFLNLKVKLADYFDESRTEDIFDYIPPQKTNQIFTPKWVVKKMVDLLEQENPGCFDDPGKTFLDPYMKSGLYITEIVKRLYRSEKMRQAFSDDNARLEHIFAKQVYGLAPTEIIYRIAISYILGFAKDHGITAHHIRQADTLEFAKAGTMERELDKIFRD